MPGGFISKLTQMSQQTCHSCHMCETYCILFVVDKCHVLLHLNIMSVAQKAHIACVFSFVHCSRQWWIQHVIIWNLLWALSISLFFFIMIALGFLTSSFNTTQDIEKGRCTVHVFKDKQRLKFAIFMKITLASAIFVAVLETQLI